MVWFSKYRDFILFIWGISLLTFIIVFHVIADSIAYLVLAAAIGLPFAADILGGKKKNDD